MLTIINVNQAIMADIEIFLKYHEDSRRLMFYFCCDIIWIDVSKLIHLQGTCASGIDQSLSQ